MLFRYYFEPNFVINLKKINTMESRTLLIAVGVFLLFIILLIRFRKPLGLLFTRIIYGKFSIEFFHLYKKYFIRSPFQYCFRDEFVSHLLFVMDKSQDIPLYKSSREIYFENTPYFIRYKEFIKLRGEPYCFNAYSFINPDFVIKAIGYQDHIVGSKAVVVYYFMNDYFFMGEYIFKNPKTNIKESLVNHFLGYDGVTEDNFYIENTLKRTIHYQDTGFTIDIKYITEEDSQVAENLRSYLNQVKNKKLVIQ